MNIEDFAMTWHPIGKYEIANKWGISEDDIDKAFEAWQNAGTPQEFIHKINPLQVIRFAWYPKDQPVLLQLGRMWGEKCRLYGDKPWVVLFYKPRLSEVSSR